MPDVFILVREPYHDGSTILGVFSSIKAAEEFGSAHLPASIGWLHGEASRYHTLRADTFVAQARFPNYDDPLDDPHNEDHLIYRFTVDYPARTDRAEPTHQ